MKSGLVSMAINCASGASRSRTGRQNVPAPGPYSTNNLVFAQSTGPSILRISRSDECTIDPTITGCLRNPWKNMLQGDETPAARRARRRAAAVVELVIGILTLVLRSGHTLRAAPSQRTGAQDGCADAANNGLARPCKAPKRNWMHDHAGQIAVIF